MTNRVCVLFSFIVAVVGQVSCQQIDLKSDSCNRATVDNSLQRYLARGLCIPRGQVISQIIDNFDFNSDNKLDVALKHTKFPKQEKEPIWFSFYQKVNDTTFVLAKRLQNLLPPFIRNMHAAQQSPDSTLRNLVKIYPYSTTVEFNQDTIKVSHMIPDVYGKTYEFVYSVSESDWILQRIVFWIGNQDARFVERMGWPASLSGRNPLELFVPEQQIRIGEFDLVHSKKLARNIESDYLSTKYEVNEWIKKRK